MCGKDEEFEIRNGGSVAVSVEKGAQANATLARVPELNTRSRGKPFRSLAMPPPNSSLLFHDT